MDFSRKPGLALLALSLAIPMQAHAGGYSAYENHQIWQLRLAAQQHAAQEAQKKCAWAPASTVFFSDQSPSIRKVPDERLRARIMTMIRLDQNARAIVVALRESDGAASEKLREVDADNLVELKEIFSRHGFPTPREVGDVATNAMLLLVAHADSDRDFQKAVARKMAEDVAEHELPAYFPAVLEAVRPEIVGKTGRSGVRTPAARDESPDTPKQCYDREYRALFDRYIRHRYKR